jgi:carbonic anhydrase
MAFLRGRLVGVGLCAAVLAAAGIAAGVAAMEPVKKQTPDGHGTQTATPPRVTPKLPKTAPAVGKPGDPVVPKAQPKSEPKAEPKPESKAEPKPDAEHQGAHEEPPPAAPAPAPKRTSDADDDNPKTIDGVLAALREGNTRWVKGKPLHPHVDLERRADTGEHGQKPFATILTCADSRLPVERIFDRGIGDLFVVRVAGNTAGTNESGSLEYAIDHFKTPVLIIMGHTKCGAVSAAASGGHVDGAVGAIVEQIRPAVERARAGNAGAKEGELVAAAVRENVWQSVFQLLKNNKTIREKAKNGELRIVGAVYSISEGTVDFMGPHPWQTEIIAGIEARSAKQGTAQAEGGGGEH